ncbi:MAG: hypothetical protein M3Z75_32090 [Actinomycetota bacterium]|nr:hypothetical protein [Actinomycetota bacterium]
MGEPSVGRDRDHLHGPDEHPGTARGPVPARPAGQPPGGADLGALDPAQLHPRGLAGHPPGPFPSTDRQADAGPGCRARGRPGCPAGRGRPAAGRAGPRREGQPRRAGRRRPLARIHRPAPD